MMCIYISRGLILYKVWGCHKRFLRITKYNIQMTDYRRNKSKTNNNIHNDIGKPLDANTLRDVWRTYLLKIQRMNEIAWKRCGIITKRRCQTACIFARLKSIHVMKILAHVCCILEKNEKKTSHSITLAMKWTSSNPSLQWQRNCVKKWKKHQTTPEKKDSFLEGTCMTFRRRVSNN